MQNSILSILIGSLCLLRADTEFLLAVYLADIDNYSSLLLY